MLERRDCNCASRRVTIAVVYQRTGGPIVYNMIVGVMCSSSIIEERRLKGTNGTELREHGVLELERVLDMIEVSDGVAVGRSVGAGVENKEVAASPPGQLVVASAANDLVVACSR